MIAGVPFDEATLRFYAEEAPVYTAAGRGGVSRYLHGFLDRLDPGAHILELGCGGGTDAEAMIARGFTVTATDGVPALARKAEERLGAPVRVMRFDELEAVESYDAVWANASLLHVPFAELPQILARVNRALKVGGLHFASYKSGETEGRDKFGRYFNYPTRDRLLEVYAISSAWEVIEAEEYIGGGYEGGTGPWVAVTLRRN